MARRTSSQRRRRRARKSTPPRRLLRVFLISLVTLLVFVLTAGCVAYHCLLSWLQGDGFRQFLSTGLRSATGAQQIDIPENLSMSESGQLGLPLIEVKGMGKVTDMKVREMHARPELAALVRRILCFSEFSSDELNVTLNFKGDKTTQQAKQAPHSREQGSATNKQSGGFFKSIRMRSYTAHYTDTSFLTPAGKFQLLGYKLAVTPYPHPSKQAWTLHFENGRVLTPLPWPKHCGLKEAELLIDPERYKLKGAEFLLSPGQISVQGNFIRRSGLWELHAELKKADVRSVLGNEWSRYATGTLNGQLSASGQGRSGEWETTGTVWLENGSLSLLPLLGILGGELASYKTIELSKAVCNFKFPYSDPQHNIKNACLWDHIDLRAKDDTLRLKGHVITGSDGSLSGTLHLGIPAKVVAGLGLSNTPLANRIFSQSDDLPDFLWLTINLSGTLSDPHEDLTARLSTLMTQQIHELPSQVVNMIQGILSPASAPNSQKDKGDSPNDTGKDAEPDVPEPRRNASPMPQDIINAGLELIL